VPCGTPNLCRSAVRAHWSPVGGRATFEHVSDRWEAEAAPTPDGGVGVHCYTPCEVVRINLCIGGDFYRGVAVAHYDAPDGRRAYDLCLWPHPESAPRGWYWFDEGRMARRDYCSPSA